MIRANTIINAIELGISQNHTIITLEITEKKIIEGALEDVKETHDITAVIYWQENQQGAKIYTDKQGMSEENMKWNMICGKDFDMTVSQTRKINFIHPISGTKFHINHSYPIIVENTVCGYECGLKEIS